MTSILFAMTLACSNCPWCIPETSSGCAYDSREHAGDSYAGRTIDEWIELFPTQMLVIDYAEAEDAPPPASFSHLGVSVQRDTEASVMTADSTGPECPGYLGVPIWVYTRSGEGLLGVWAQSTLNIYSSGELWFSAFGVPAELDGDPGFSYENGGQDLQLNVELRYPEGPDGPGFGFVSLGELYPSDVDGAELYNGLLYGRMAW